MTAEQRTPPSVAQATPGVTTVEATLPLTPASTATPQRTGLDQVVAEVNALDQVITVLPIAIAKLFASVFAIFLISVLVWRLKAVIWPERQIVVEQFVNASGDHDLDGRLAGLSQLLRERLIEGMQETLNRPRRTMPTVFATGHPARTPGLHLLAY